MKCSAMLTLLLEAERAELEGIGSSTVAAHVRECAACRAVASRLLTDTSTLAAHVRARGVQLRSAAPATARRTPKLAHVALWGGAIAATAATVLLLTLERRAPDATHPSVATVKPALPASSVAMWPEATRPSKPVGASSPSKPPRPSSPSRPALATPPSGLVPVQAKRFPDAVAATPVQFIASQPVEQPMRPSDSTGVSVTPPAGTRSLVLATRDPKITVVWLY